MFAGAITTDAAGNIYATATFSSTNDFDPGPVFNLQSVNAEDIFPGQIPARWQPRLGENIGDFRYQAGYTITLDSLGIST